jgi:hypothetical protein
VNSQAKTTLEAADMVLEEVGVFIEVDGLKRKLSQTLPAVSIGSGGAGDTAAAELRTCTILYMSASTYRKCSNMELKTNLIIHGEDLLGVGLWYSRKGDARFVALWRVG